MLPPVILSSVVAGVRTRLFPNAVRNFTLSDLAGRDARHYTANQAG